jgi:2,4-dienoyl-CoA reductase (NADPH2)
VTLLERESRLGGQVALAATVPSRAELLDLTRNLVAAANGLGVCIRTRVEATASMVEEWDPDVVVLATGARPLRPWWAGSYEEMPRVVDVRDVLEGKVSPSGRVLLVDDLGFHQATSVAELLADRGAAVEIVTAAMVVGGDLGVTLDLETWNIRALRKGIRQATDLVAMGVSQRDPLGGAYGELELQLVHHPTGMAANRIADWVVVATHQAPEDSLWHALRSAAFEVHRVGDCLAPRRAHSAIIEGHRVGVAI